MTDFLLKKRPNIVLIMCDQMRGDCLGIAGHPDVKTPYLDSLAAEGTYFPNSYSCLLYTSSIPNSSLRLLLPNPQTFLFPYTRSGRSQAGLQ